MAEFEIYKDANLEFRWRFKANNGKMLAESAEGYNNPAYCEHAIIWRPFLASQGRNPSERSR
jgi:uncharacterized protein YegP (UPF0339 family)